jgi:hypothetical protein
VKRNNLLKSAALIFLAVAMMLPLAGCMPGGKELAMAFVEEWMDDNNINPSTPTGIFNIGRRLASGSTGDMKADAALETVQMVQNFVAAEKLRSEGKWASNEARAYTYFRLADLYGARATTTGSTQDRDASNAYMEQYNIYNGK